MGAEERATADNSLRNQQSYLLHHQTQRVCTARRNEIRLHKNMQRDVGVKAKEPIWCPAPTRMSASFRFDEFDLTDS